MVLLWDETEVRGRKPVQVPLFNINPTVWGQDPFLGGRDGRRLTASAVARHFRTRTETQRERERERENKKRGGSRCSGRNYVYYFLEGWR